MFIVIEGIDGSGKGTQVEIISEKLKEKGKKVKVLDYPRYGEKSAFMVEKYLNGEYGKNISAKKASIFYAIDRYDHSIELKKDLENYDYIISNRYVSASMIHQAGKIENGKEREEFLNWLEDLEYNIFSIPKPDKTIFLSVSPKTSQKLVLQKQERSYLKLGKKMDIHEADENHLRNAYNTALEVIDRYNDWIKIDCEEKGEMKSIDEITGLILEKILN